MEPDLCPMVDRLLTIWGATMKPPALTLIAALIVVGSAFADAHTGTVSLFDADGDAMLNEPEFGEAEGGRRFMSHDVGGSDTVPKEEFRAGDFARYDRGRASNVNGEGYARFVEDGGEEED